jgi:ABC-type glycerol-3-phosphate transport system substrate-binding protein
VVEVRVKAPVGPGGMLDSLTSASAAAPLSLPDLVALPRPELETAALKGLIHPFDGLIQPIDETDWYEFARQLARLQNSTFGLPFAGDALLLVYRPSALPEPPNTYSGTLSTLGPLIFPAADPKALFTLLQYQAAGGVSVDEQGRPSLQPKPLAQVLEFYQQGRLGDNFPDWLTGYQEDEQSWQAFTANNAPMVVTWMSRYLNQPSAAAGPTASPGPGTPPAVGPMAEWAGAPLPTPSGDPYTLATGWVWAMASPDPEREKLSAELAEYLTEAEFLADWSSALGYLPPRQSALQGWGNPSKRALASQLVNSARLIPSEDVLASLSPPMQSAAIQVLKLESGPVEAAQQAAEHVTTP